MKNLFTYGLVRYRHDLRLRMKAEGKKPINFGLKTLHAVYSVFASAISRILTHEDCEEQFQLEEFLWTTFELIAKDCDITDKDLNYAFGRFQCEGYKFLTVTIVLLDKALLRGLGTGVFVCPENFKCIHGSSLPTLFYTLFRQVFNDEGVLLDNASPIAIMMLRQLCGFAYKLKLDATDDQKNDVIKRFIANEEELPTAGEWDSPFVKRMGHFASIIFRGYSRESLTCRCGPGVTADTEYTQKLSAKLPPVSSNWSFADHHFFNENDAFPYGSLPSDRAPVHNNFSLFQGVTAKVMLVPKDSRGPRLISAEPSSLQYVQQGIKDFFVDRLEGHPLSSGSVNFVDQTINQQIAQSGSVDQSWSTLDLKDASDRISLELVSRVFGGVPDLLTDLMLTRSVRTCLPDGRTIRLAKFAPMGSALCFPVLATTVFLASLVALELKGIPFTHAKQFVRVYGDDIAVRSEYVPVVKYALEHIGLKLNEDKCFINSKFLESCGMDAFLGNDVTPVRLRQWISQKPEDQTNLISVVNAETEERDLLRSKVLATLETANLLAARGFRAASEYLYSLVESWLYPLPYGYPHSSFLCRWTYRTDVWESTLMERGLKRKILNNRNGVQVRVVTVGATPPVKDDEDGYAHWLRVKSQIGTGLEIPSQGEFSRRHVVAFNTRYVDENAFTEYPANRWTPSRDATSDTSSVLPEREEARRRLAAINGLL